MESTETLDLNTPAMQAQNNVESCCEIAFGGGWMRSS